MIDLQPFFEIHERMLSSTPESFKRYAYYRINWEDRLLGIVGARGCGKTTLLLQKILEKRGVDCLYISADNPLVLKESIYAIGDAFFKIGGKTLIVDEAHRQTGWSNDIKALYDAHPTKQIYFSGSSKFSVLMGTADLSRRAVLHELKHLSFREFVNLETGSDFSAVSPEELLQNHRVMSNTMLRFEPLKLFREYLRVGSYPFRIASDSYYERLLNVLDKSIYQDVVQENSLRGEAASVAKKIIAFVATSVVPSISPESLSRDLGISKVTLYAYLDSLERAGVLRRVPPCGRGLKGLRSGSKVFLGETNIYYALGLSQWNLESNMGTIREAFFVSQVSHLGICVPKNGDFALRLKDTEIVFEIGGAHKGKKQLRDVPNGIVLRDGIETGFGNVVPLYLLGFLY
ncbi:ATP-binding protein [Mesotoga sp.]|uniref:ATP-binding protein n=1 Tax=Mesotoga sp. TaxID=2053577 RepID=UPI00345E0B21